MKYTGKQHQGVCLHTDSAQVTVNVALSNPNDFAGGGTYFEILNETITLEQGEMLLHPGKLRHSGTEVTAGVRYIFVVRQICLFTYGIKFCVGVNPIFSRPSEFLCVRMEEFKSWNVLLWLLSATSFLNVDVPGLTCTYVALKKMPYQL